jgi:hypothetical protein
MRSIAERIDKDKKGNCTYVIALRNHLIPQTVAIADSNGAKSNERSFESVKVMIYQGVPERSPTRPEQYCANLKPLIESCQLPLEGSSME